ncbi:MAG TPA: alkaline phosphatase family protein [Phycisphaerae bacterium]|nr:alkaline phosphatase family protein [Phycisphaerae bacterium]HRR86351.1 alkaline phosphatase family protein [Phycisphaerae bacterium]
MIGVPRTFAATRTTGLAAAGPVPVRAVSSLSGCDKRSAEPDGGRGVRPGVAAVIGVAFTFVLPGLLSGCASLDVRLAESVERPPRSVVVFFPDGMDVQRMDELVAEGRLPNIRERFIENGVRVRHAFSSLPTSTYPNCSSLLTGRFPGHHQIPGNFWFDRRTMECRDYMTLGTCRTVNHHLAVPTLYDWLGDHFTVSIAHHTYRGVTESIDGAEGFFWAWALGHYRMADSRVSIAMKEVIRRANRVGRWPSVVMTYYPGVDEIGHRFGTYSSRYAEALINVDRIVGEITALLEKSGLTESTYCILMADHGMVPARQSIDVLDWMGRVRKVRIRRRSIEATAYVDRWEQMLNYDAVGGVDAGRVAMVHLRGRRGWGHRPAPQEVLDFANAQPPLYELPAIQMVFLRDGPNRVRALSKNGTLAVERRLAGNEKQYRLSVYEGDPLEYLGEASLAEFVRAGWHSSGDWLAATATSRFPDFVPQVVEMFDSPRTGDMVIMSADDWLLYRRGEVAGHGSCLARDMRIPLFFAGPDLPKGGRIDHARLVDIAPTILGLLGESRRLEGVSDIDGINLADELRRAAAP